MRKKILIPENDIFKALFFNAETVCEENNLELIRLPEETIGEYFKNNKADVAFLNPIQYGMGVGIADYRIIPVNAFVVSGYSRLASIYFRKGMLSIKSVASPNPNDFLIKIGALLLAERYGLTLDLKKSESKLVDEILTQYDAAILWKKNFVDDSALDITEDWYESFNKPLPMGAWVCRNEEEPENIDKIIKLFESDSLKSAKDVIDREITDYEPRQGTISFDWNENVENAFDEILEFLFYHNFFKELPAVKILGRDPDLPE